MRIKAAVLAVVLLFIIGTVRSHLGAKREISAQKATGLAAATEVGWDANRLWKQSFVSTAIHDAAVGVVGGIPGTPSSTAITRPALMTYVSAEALPADKKIIRTASLNIVVADVRQTVLRITEIASCTKGGIDASAIDGRDANSANVKVRVPDAQLDAVIQQFTHLASSVESESLQSRDVTREFVDLGARLRNLQSEEQRYLDIMRSATTVKDILSVAEKLSDVRGQIEQLQAQVDGMQHDIDMSVITVSLYRQSEMRVLGIEWKPLFHAKVAARDVLAGLGDWVDSVVAFILNVPLIALWGATILLLVSLCGKVCKWILSWLFPNVRWVWRKSTNLS